MLLSTCTKEQYYRIDTLPDYGLIDAIGLTVGQTVYVQTRGLFHGPTVIKKQNRHYAIGRELADQIEVSEVEDDGLL